MKSLAEIYTEAADRLAVPGVWTQGNDANLPQHSCANLMLKYVAGGSDPDDIYPHDYLYDDCWSRASNNFDAFLRMNHNMPNLVFWTIVDWNDQPGMSAGYVVYMLRAAARHYHGTDQNDDTPAMG